MKLSKIVNVIDVETTCWEPPSTKPPLAISEIIEIGISVVDTQDFVVLENHSVFVRPQRSDISPFCSNLTGLTKYDLMSGVYFQNVLPDFKSTFHTDKRVFVSWGDYDRQMIESNCKEYGCEYPFGPRHVNFRNIFTILHGLSNEPDIKEALSIVGLTFEGNYHRGIDDSKNIANLLIATLKKFRGVA
jgi:inhibitor of KinA sporulation pathway (predicted exonuclease)